MISENVSSWRESRVFKRDVDNTESAKVVFEDSEYTINESTASWGDFKNLMQNISAIDFVKDIAEYKENLKNPFLNIEFKLGENKVNKYVVIKVDDNYYVKSSTLERLYQVFQEDMSKVLEFVNNRK